MVRKRVPDEFGIIIPKENGINWMKQAGGFSCIQFEIEGVFIPLGRLKYNLGRPSWQPASIKHKDYIENIQPSMIPKEKMPEFPDSVIDNDGFKSEDQCHKWVENSEFSDTSDLFKFVYNLNEHPDRPEYEDKITSIDPEDIPQSDYKTLPEKVKNNGFDSIQTYLDWIEDSEQYGWIELWNDAHKFTYGVFENLDSDPRERWESSEDLWNEIESQFPFKYKKLDYEEYKDRELPASPPAIQPIRITSAVKGKKSYSTDLTDLEDSVVILLAPNSD